MKQKLIKTLVFLSLFAPLMVGCSGEKNKECEHSNVVEQVVKEATCVESGTKNVICSDCNVVIETITVDPLGHDLKYFEKVDATHETSGHDEYYRCTRCKLYFSDSEAKNQISYPSIAKGEHEFTLQVEDEKFLYKEATCTSPAIYYKSCSCGQKGTETFFSGDALGHDYHLNTDETEYECSRCHDTMTSGKKDVDVGQKNNTYIFLGSSITNGYHGTIDNTPYSMADMFKEDYIKVSYKYYNGTILVEKNNIYLRKIANGATGDIVSGTFKYYDDTFVFDGKGNATLNGSLSFKYTVHNNNISITKAVGNMFNFDGEFYKGDTVYKKAVNGYTLTNYEPRYVPGSQVGSGTSYVKLLQSAVNDWKNIHVDTIIFQLSTNDVGQYKDSSCTQLVDKGNVSAADVLSSDKLDTNTSVGALEWLVAKAKETWGCKVVIYTCHMSTSEYATYKNNSYDISKVHTAYHDLYEDTLSVAAKWKTGLINLWADKDVNVAIHEDAARCLADSLHLQVEGYEKVLYQEFRKYCEKEDY